MKANDLKCPVCGAQAVQLTGKEVYSHRHDLRDRKFWVCPAWHAYVGCHPVSGEPLGTLATLELRRMRMTAHKIFDQLWKQSIFPRKGAYVWLAGKLGISAEECHIGMFEEDRCKLVISACREVLNK